ncbi:hypothetical protein J6590_032950 [Homalodisca vitripennis]|nr:hypothetical protein J6590_032950 [Homalodisca vitripennis]
MYATYLEVWKKQPSVYLRNLSWMSITAVDKVTTIKLVRHILKSSGNNDLPDHIPCAAAGPCWPGGTGGRVPLRPRLKERVDTPAGITHKLCGTTTCCKARAGRRRDATARAVTN